MNFEELSLFWTFIELGFLEKLLICHKNVDSTTKLYYRKSRMHYIISFFFFEWVIVILKQNKIWFGILPKLFCIDFIMRLQSLARLSNSCSNCASSASRTLSTSGHCSGDQPCNFVEGSGTINLTIDVSCYHNVLKLSKVYNAWVYI